MRCRFDPCFEKIPLEEEMATCVSILAWKSREGLWAIVHGVPKSWTRLSAHVHTHWGKRRNKTFQFIKCITKSIILFEFHNNHTKINIYYYHS